MVSDATTPSEAPSSVPPAEGPAVATKPPRQIRKVLLVVLGFLLALSAVAAGTVFYFYDRATAIDRSNPQVVAEQFLDTALVLRDPNKLSLFICNGWSAQDAMAVAAPPADTRVVVSWGDYSTRTAGDEATVEVRVEFTVDAGTLSAGSVRLWTLELENQDGWRVCALRKQTLLNP